MQEYRHNVSVFVILLTVGALVVNPEEGLDADQRKANWAKAIQFGASLGMSKADLPQDLQTKVENWLRSGNPLDEGDVGEEAAKKKKRKSSDTQNLGKKQQRVQKQQGAERKRKKS